MIVFAPTLPDATRCASVALAAGSRKPHDNCIAVFLPNLLFGEALRLPARTGHGSKQARSEERGAWPKGT